VARGSFSKKVRITIVDDKKGAENIRLTIKVCLVQGYDGVLLKRISNQLPGE
jgi:hypothetical protein